MNFKKALSVLGRDLVQLSDGESAALKAGDYGKDIQRISKKFGFLSAPKEPLAVACFVTKGGVLKTSLVHNLARMSALHGLKVCVVGLDMQGDISQILDPSPIDDSWDLKQAIQDLNTKKGLADVFVGSCPLESAIYETDINGLDYIPETPELVSVDQSLLTKNRREYWLKEHVIDPLKQQYDLILLDCSPNWNRLTNNALVGADGLIAPLECKINHYRNVPGFLKLLADFESDMGLNLNRKFVPTRLNSSRRLSRDIYQDYRVHLKDCSRYFVRDCVQGEEASQKRVSVCESVPSQLAAAEMRLLIHELGLTFGFARSYEVGETSDEMDRAVLELDRIKVSGTPAFSMGMGDRSKSEKETSEDISV